MPPFSACSICKGRTRKMVKDPRTLKQIYVCPSCFKSQVQKEESDNLKRNGQAKLILNENHKTAEKVKSLPRIDDNKKIKDPHKVIQMNKITPPVMQTVIIKNRKYVAISETADDE
ncbi:uncharacterized protein [Drosophila takahashii]|uniref:uncharacterized protein n=1 Tax=Drosophila takahashii TaxID=29030 RepID=UPI001CF8D7BA|nr:uncharacterized protein LOC108062743 [Drosophila takahashii]